MLKWFLYFIFIFSVTETSAQHVNLNNLWTLGTDGRDRSWRMTFDSNRNYFIVGSSDPYLNFDLNGGQFTGTSDQFAGYYLARYRSDNSIQWAMHTKYSILQLAPALTAIDHRDNLFMAGIYKGSVDIDFSDTSTMYLPPSVNKYSLFFARYDSSGVLLNHDEVLALPDSVNQLIGDATFFTDIAVDKNDNIFVSGYSGDILTSPLISDTLFEFNFFLIKIDSTGTVQWMKSIQKEVREFHNWTYFSPLMIDIDAKNDIYLTFTFGDSVNIRFKNEPPLYLPATPYLYLGPGAESSNTDFVVVKYDNDGNYIRHHQFNSPDASRQKQLDAIITEGDRLIILSAFDHTFETPIASYVSQGQDSVYDYNLVLLECDTQLTVRKSQLYHNNILSPRPHHNLLKADSCGNLFLWSDLVIYDGSPFSPFYDQSIRLLDRNNIYLFDRNLSITDSIVLSNFHLSDYFDIDVAFGEVKLFGTYFYIYALYTQAVVERNYNSSSPFYDCFIASLSYDGCEKRYPEKISQLEFPNIFTPNDDSKNQVFKPKEMENIENLVIHIYNRWGRKIFSGKENNWWDGNSGNEKCTDGVYFYTATYKENNSFRHTSGTVTLLR